MRQSYPIERLLEPVRSRTARLENMSAKLKQRESSWPLGEMDEQELYIKLFPEKEKKESPVRPMPDWEEVQKEKRQKGVTLQLL